MAAPVGIGLRAPHYAALAERRPPLAFLEVHSENFFGDGGPGLAWLDFFRVDYDLSLHGVGLSLGSTDPLDERHLAKLSSLVRRVSPLEVSEHLCWSSSGGRHANDLLPLPFTPEAVTHVVARIQRVQECLKRSILVENISSYRPFAQSTLQEPQFVAEVCRRAGCGLLLDVNNVWVNSVNHGFDPMEWMSAIAPSSVREIHLAGYEATPEGLIDTHGAPVFPEVWALFRATLERIGPRPTLVEWDVDIPDLDILLQEAWTARRHMEHASAGKPAQAAA